MIEANPNPELNEAEGFARSAAAAGIPYEALFQRVLVLGMRHQSPRKES